MLDEMLYWFAPAITENIENNKSCLKLIEKKIRKKSYI